VPPQKQDGDQFEPRCEPARNPCLDGIRGIAILLVIVHHTFQFLTAKSPLGQVVVEAALAGWTGVDLFFVLSGYLITVILLNTRNRNRGDYFRIFYMRRFLRIFPIYYFYLFLLLLMSLAVPSVISSLYLWWNAVYLANLHIALMGWGPRIVGHLWSLSVEEQFYLIWPAFIYLMPRRHTLKAIAILFFLFVVVRQCVCAAASNVAIYVAFHIDGLLLGAFVGTLASQQTQSYALQVAWVILILSSIALLAQFLVSGEFNWVNWHGLSLLNFSLLAICGAALVAVSIYSDARAPINRILSSRLLVEFGLYSYAIYIFHVPLDSFLRSNHLHPDTISGAIVYTLVFLVIVYGIARLSWRLVEEPCIKIKQKWFSYSAKT